MSMLDPRRLHLLVELADRGTIAAVADALHFTPSTVSHGLAALERDLGVSLLERSARSVRLTEAGETLARDGRAILASIGAAEAEARAVGRLDQGRLTLATFPSAGATFVAHAVGLLRERYPAVELRLLDAEPAESLDRVAEGEIDVALVYEYPYLPVQYPTGVDRIELLDDPIQVCLPPNHAASERPHVELRELCDEAFVAGRRGSPCNAFAQALCGRAGFKPQISFETDDIAFTCALVNEGVAIAIMPRLLVTTAGQPIRARPLAPTIPPRRICVAYRASAASLPSIQAARAALRDAATSDAASGRALAAIA
jgi:DNA-binding transcriptional LysR family regulator